MIHKELREEFPLWLSTLRTWPSVHEDGGSSLTLLNGLKIRRCCGIGCKQKKGKKKKKLIETDKRKTTQQKNGQRLWADDSQGKKQRQGARGRPGLQSESEGTMDARGAEMDGQGQ